MEGLAPPKEEKRVRTATPRDNWQKMLAEARGARGILKYRDPAIILLAVGTGARSGEIRALRIPEIDWNAHTLILHGKNQEDRRARMGRPLERALREWLRHRPEQPHDFVFISERGKPMSADLLWAMISNLSRYAEVGHAHPHQLRHTFAAEFTASNRDILATSRRLGHRRVSTTERYIQSLGVDYGLDENYRTPDEGSRW